ncbi:hypothetical protein GS416_05715 [Rhodococcus hoagii]|nr:hypothetical protein [Prescottella equi]
MTSKLARLGRLTPKQAWSIAAPRRRSASGTVRSRPARRSRRCSRWLMLIPTAPRTGEIVMIGRTRDTVYRN